MHEFGPSLLWAGLELGNTISNGKGRRVRTIITLNSTYRVGFLILMFVRLNSNAEKGAQKLRDLIQNQQNLVDVDIPKLLDPGVVVVFPRTRGMFLEMDFFSNTDNRDHVGYAAASELWSENWYICPRLGTSGWYVCANIGMSRFLEVVPEKLLDGHNDSRDRIMCFVNGRKVGFWDEVINDASGDTHLYLCGGENFRDHIKLSKPCFNNQVSLQKNSSICFPLSSRQTFLDFIQIIARIVTLCILIKRPRLRGPIVMVNKSCKEVDMLSENFKEDEVMTLVALALALRSHYYSKDCAGIDGE